MTTLAPRHRSSGRMKAMPVTYTKRDSLLDEGLVSVFTSWQLDALDAVARGLRSRGCLPTLLRGVKRTRGPIAHITYYTDVADPARSTCRVMHVTWGA